MFTPGSVTAEALLGVRTPQGWGHPQTKRGDGDVGLHLPPVRSAGSMGAVWVLSLVKG